ncbi:MAG: hypothetical protein QUU85_05435 [Candidatus Eisenbacteria bacterium]|nr:hypothetical protein [Candidatus Eisenbacteria bacterium]
MVPLFVLGTILFFLGVDAIVVASRKRKAALAPVAAPVRELPGPRRMPAGMFLHPSHVWLTVAADGRVHVGLDELAERLFGPIDEVRFAAEGSRIERGQTLPSVVIGNQEIPISSPVSGVLLETQRPEGGSDLPDPSRWLCTLKAERLGEEIRPLRIAEDATAWLAAEFARLRESLHGLRAEVAAALPDGGEPAHGLLRALDPSSRQKLVHEFLIPQE